MSNKKKPEDRKTPPPTETRVKDIMAKGKDHTYALYKALADKQCVKCGERIPAGSHFTKHLLGSSDNRIHAQCQRCFTFTTIDRWNGNSIVI